MPEHFIEKCTDCGTIISQCRCPSKEKVTILSKCTSCDEKRKKIEELEKNRAQDPTPFKSTLVITCYCGIARLLPDNVQLIEDAIIELPPCGRCGIPFRGRYIGNDQIESHS